MILLARNQGEDHGRLSYKSHFWQSTSYCRIKLDIQVDIQSIVSGYKYHYMDNEAKAHNARYVIIAGMLRLSNCSQR